MNTFEFNRAVRDAADLTTTERAVLWCMATYLPNICPSMKSLAKGAGVHRDTLGRAMKSLEKKGWFQKVPTPGRANKYNLTPPHSTPPTPLNDAPPCTMQGGAYDPPHPPAQCTPEETRKRQEQETNNQTDCKTARDASTDSHAGLVELDSDLLVEERAVVVPPPIPDTPSTWMAKWADVWGKVCGHAPLPPLAQIEALHCDELRFAAALARVAALKNAGTLRSARKAFFGTLRKLAEQEDHEISAWTPAGVLQELEGEKVKTSTVPYHRPAAPVTPELTEEQREANRAVMRQWVMTPSGDLLHTDSPEYKRYQAALERRGVTA